MTQIILLCYVKYFASIKIFRENKKNPGLTWPRSVFIINIFRDVRINLLTRRHCMQKQTENCTITFFPIGDQFTITWSKSDLRSDQDHDLEYCNKVIGDQITWSKSDLRSDQDHFVPYKCVTELKKKMIICMKEIFFFIF